MTVNIQIETDLGGMRIVVTGEAEPDRDSINQQVDLLASAMDRQSAKVILKETLVDWIAATKALNDMPTAERAFLSDRMRERAALWSQMEIAHNDSPRRGVFSPNRQQRQALDDFDATTTKKREDYARALKEAKDNLPHLEKRLERLRERMAGKDPLIDMEDEKRTVEQGVAEAA